MGLHDDAQHQRGGHLMAGCCPSKPANGGSSGGGGGDTHENVGVGPDVYIPPSASPAQFTRLRTYPRGQVGDDTLGGLEVIVDPADPNTRLAQWRNFYEQDLSLSQTSSPVFQVASSWAIPGAGGTRSLVIWWSVLACVDADICEVRLMVDGVQYDLWRTNENPIPPSPPQTRFVKVDLVAATDPLPVEIQYRSVFGFQQSVVEDKTLFGLQYST